MKPLNIFLLFLCLSLLIPVQAQPNTTDVSSCLMFVDYDFIFTLELIKEKKGVTPILNVICLTRGQHELTPSEIRLYLGDEEYPVTHFSIDSGDKKQPFVTQYLGIRGPDSAGVDLVGDFKKVKGLSEVAIEMGRDRFLLDALGCNDYDAKMDKIAELDMDGGNQIDDFEALDIKLFGRREAK